MNRRNVIKAAGITGLSTIFPFSKSQAHTTGSRLQNAPFFEFKIGTLPLKVVTDGHVVFQPVQPVFAPTAPAAEVTKILQEHFLPANLVDIALNILVLQKDNRIILFDTGCGFNFGGASGKLAQNLVASGTHLADVTDIVLTHAHPDHIGGLLDKNGQPVFPNATVHLSKPEYDFWMSEAPDFSKSKFTDKAATDSWVALAHKNLSVLENRISFYSDNQTLFDCITVQLAPGHTPGHAMMRIHSGNEVLVHIGDIAHNHVLLLAHPEWGVGLDTDFDKAAAMRKQVLAEIATGRYQLFSYHLPWPGLGHVRAKGKGYEWLPQAFYTL